MHLFSKQKFYIWVIGILIILNLTTVFFLWKGRPGEQQLSPGNGNGRMGEFLNRELNLTQDQADKFDQYRREHFETTSSLSKQINEKRKAIMNEVFSSNPDTSKVNKLTGEIGELNAQLEKFLFNHFTKLKSVLDKDQISRFENLVRESMKPKQGIPPRPNPRDGAPPRAR